MAVGRQGASASDGTGKSPEAYRTISEASSILAVAPHVLRFWESRFNQIRPVKRAGGRRYYRPDDLALLGRIRELLHDQGYSIRGVQKLLKSEGVRGVIGNVPAEPETAEEAPSPPPDASRKELEAVLWELVALRDLLR